MKKQEYAIVDIETTGSNASGSRITEIAIIIHDGTNIIDRWETLVNPEREIPLAIFSLTGINNEMVRDAPIFDDISEKVLEMLTDRIFVAHNVNFDYSFVRHQLEESGLNGPLENYVLFVLQERLNRDWVRIAWVGYAIR